MSSPNSQPPTKTAIVTGGCSGIGLALVQHLLSKQDQIWRVVIADIRPEAYTEISATLDESRVLFITTNVASWEDNASLFKRAYEWTNQQIDFFAANAGIPDRERIAEHFDLDAEPQKPDLSCVDVDLGAVFYGLKLFIHYSRKTQRHLKDANDFHPKMVITSSCTGQYSFPVAPQYAAAKHACVGLTRAVGDSLLKHDDIAVNCIMPGFVETNIMPKELVDLWPREHVTPLSTMCRAFDELVDVDGKVSQDGKSDGRQGLVKTAQCVECSVDRLYYRSPVEFPDESQAFCVNEAKEGGVWDQGFMAFLKARQMSAGA